MLRLMSVLLVIALLIPVMSCSISRSAGFEDISVEECYTLIQENQENPDFIILDVRTPSEYASGYIENAVNF